MRDVDLTNLDYTHRQHLDGLCHNTNFIVQIHEEDMQGLSSSQLLGKSAVLFLDKQSLLVGQFEHVRTRKSVYTFTLHSFFSTLEDQRPNRVFLGVTLENLISQLVQEMNAQSYIALKWKTKFKNHRFDWLVQYDESSYALLLRALTQLGLFARFFYHQDVVYLYISDNFDGVILGENQPLTVNLSLSSHLSAFQPSLTQCKQVTPKFYNLKAHHKDNLRQSFEQNYSDPKGVLGSLHINREGFQSVNEAKQFLDIIVDANAWKKEFFLLESDTVLIPGRVVNLEDGLHPCTEGRLFRVIDVHHQAKQVQGFVAYRQKALLIPAEQNYRLPFLDRPAIEHLLAIVDAPSQHSRTEPYIEGDGFYRVKLEFDEVSKSLQGSIALRRRLLGANHSIEHHHPFLPGTKVILGFLNGQIESPVILGALRKEDETEVIHAHNPDQLIIRSHHGSQLQYDAKAENLQFSTPNEQENITFKHSENEHSLTIENQKAGIHVQASKQIKVESNSILVDTQISHIETKEFEAQSEKIVFIGQKIKFLSKRHHDPQSALRLNSQRILVTANKISVHTQTLNLHSNQNITLSSMGGGASINSKVAQIKAAHSLKLDCGQSYIELKASGEIIINGPVIQLKGVLGFAYQAVPGLFVPRLITRLGQSAGQPWVKELLDSYQQTECINLTFVLNTGGAYVGGYTIICGGRSCFRKSGLEGKDSIKVSKADLKGKFTLKGLEILCPIHKIPVSEIEFTYEGAQTKVFTVFFPPIVVNLRNKSIGKYELALSTTQIRYLQQNGNNATLFIHGFNVSAGVYDTYNDTGATRSIMLEAHEYHLKQNDAKSTSMQQSFYTQHCKPTEDKAWFVRMEYYLNRAAGMPRDNFTLYSRIIGVSWRGDTGTFHFNRSHARALKAAESLVSLIMQLNNAGIKVNIIAHSMGCKVTLRLLHLLGSEFNTFSWFPKSSNQYVQQAFLWQSAIPDYALGTQPKDDQSIDQSCQFFNAHKSTQHITILTSLYDDVLNIPSRLYYKRVAHYQGRGFMYHENALAFTRARQSYLEASFTKYWAEQDYGTLNLVFLDFFDEGITPDNLHHLSQTNISSRQERLAWYWSELLFHPWPEERIQQPPETKSPEYFNADLDYIRKNVKEKIHIRIDMQFTAGNIKRSSYDLKLWFDMVRTKVLFDHVGYTPMGYECKVKTLPPNATVYAQNKEECGGHSYMSTPTDICFESVYKKQIMARIKKFGAYPDYIG